MSGNWSKNPDAFQSSLAYSEAIKNAVVARDQERLDAILAEPNFRHDAITPALIGKAHRSQQTGMLAQLMSQAIPGVQQAVVTEMSRGTVSTSELVTVLRLANPDQLPGLVNHAIFKGFHFKRDEAFFWTLLDLTPLASEDLRDPLLKWVAAQQWPLVEHTLHRMADVDIPWGELLVRLSKEETSPPDHLLTLALEHTQAEAQRSHRDNAFSSAARTGNLSLLDRMLMPPYHALPLEHAFEVAWVQKQEAIIDRLLPLVNFGPLGARLVARIPRQANLPDTDPNKVTWRTMDELGCRIPLAAKKNWLDEYSADRLPMTQASARQHEVQLGSTELSSARQRRRLRS